MPPIVVLAEHADGVPDAMTVELLALASQLGDPVAVAMGQGSANIMAPALAQAGAGLVFEVVLDGLPTWQGWYDHPTAPVVEALAAAVTAIGADLGPPAAVLLGSTPEGKEIAARFAVRSDGGLLADAVAIRPNDVGTGFVARRLAFGGTVVVEVVANCGLPAITVVPGAVDYGACLAARSASKAVPEVRTLTVTPSREALAVRVVHGQPKVASKHPDLAKASVVVAGGRGTGGDFAPIEALADALGGVVGASRAAVDAGWCTPDQQIGQTGRQVNPQLYIGAGISGAVQHLSGMRSARTIVAINNDREAPIFDLADFGIVGNLFTVLPQAAAEIAKRRVR